MTATSSAVARRTARARRRVDARRDLVGAALAVPALVLFLAFAIWPAIRVFYLSLYEYSLTAPPEWVGLDHFRFLLHSAEFHGVVANSLFYVAGTYVPAVGLALGLALALHSRMPGAGAIRLLYFVPVAMSWVAVSVIWRLVLQPEGLLNQTLGVEVNWLTSTATAKWGLVLMSVWKETGFFLILFLAGLTTIPKDLYEAAFMDGCNAWQRFWHVTLPMLKPITAICSVMAVIRGFQAFSAQYVMTGGGFGTEVVNLYVYKTAFESARMGRASAVAVLMFVLLLVLTLLQLRVFRRSDR